VKRSIVLRSIKNQGEVRLDDDQTRISGARRADVTGVGAWEPPCRGIGIAKILKKLQIHPRQGCHPVDVGLYAAIGGAMFGLALGTMIGAGRRATAADATASTPMLYPQLEPLFRAGMARKMEVLGS
jgi:hypothetical protein